MNASSPSLGRVAPPLAPRPLLRAGLPGSGSTAVARPRPALAPNAVLADREDVTADIARLTVVPDGSVPSFEPGQYFSLGLTLEDGPLLRPYSTASPRGACGSLEFLIRRVSTGTFTPRLWDLAVGEKLWIGPPKGLFTLKPGDPRTHLLVSAGTGIAPFISMLPELIGGVATEPVAAERVAAERLAPEPPSGARPRVVVAHGVSYEPELAYRAWLESLARERHGLVYAPAVSRPNAPQNAGWTGRLGRVETVLPELWTELALEPQDSVAYLCGNPDMVARSREILLGLGMPADAVIHENYWAAPTSLASTGAAA